MQRSLQTQPLPPPSVTGCSKGVLSLDIRNLQNRGYSAPKGAPSPPEVTPSLVAGCLSLPLAAYQTPGRWRCKLGLTLPNSSHYKPCTLGTGRCHLLTAPATFADGVSSTKIHCTASSRLLLDQLVSFLTGCHVTLSLFAQCFKCRRAGWAAGKSWTLT